MSDQGSAPAAPNAGGAPPPGGSSKTPWIVAGVVAVVAVVAVGLILILDDDNSAEAEVFLEPATTIGEDPFTGDVAEGDEPVVPEDAELTGEETPPAGAVQSQSGATPGLYGGTRNDRTCNKQQLVLFLKENQAKGQAWASVLGITYDQIESYVAKLTGVTLIHDTRVTNHGYRNGQATVIQSVLQSGTAVLVDEYGVPRVRCSCGNPLTPPTAVKTPVYTGPPWQWWNPGGITVINQSTTIIDIFVLVDIGSGTTYARPAGTDGGDDTDAPDAAEEPEDPDTTSSTVISDEFPTTAPPTAPPTTAPPTTRPPTTTTTAPAPAYTAQDIIDLYFQRRDGSCAGVSYPFEPHLSEQQSAYDLGDGTWQLTVLGQTETGQQRFVWIVNPSTDTFTPTSANSRIAADYCSAWAS